MNRDWKAYFSEEAFPAGGTDPGGINLDPLSILQPAKCTNNKQQKPTQARGEQPQHRAGPQCSAPHAQHEKDWQAFTPQSIADSQL